MSLLLLSSSAIPPAGLSAAAELTDCGVSIDGERTVELADLQGERLLSNTLSLLLTTGICYAYARDHLHS